MEHTDRNRLLDKAQKKRLKAKQCPSEQSHRLEIWILPDGSSSQDQIRDDENDSDDLLGLSVVEVGSDLLPFNLLFFVEHMLNVESKPKALLLCRIMKV